MRTICWLFTNTHHCLLNKIKTLTPTPISFSSTSPQKWCRCCSSVKIFTDDNGAATQGKSRREKGEEKGQDDNFWTGPGWGITGGSTCTHVFLRGPWVSRLLMPARADNAECLCSHRATHFCGSHYAITMAVPTKLMDGLAGRWRWGRGGDKIAERLRGAAFVYPSPPPITGQAKQLRTWRRRATFASATQEGRMH